MANDRQVSTFDDEISITDLFLKIWQRRALIFVLTFLAAMIGVTVVLFQAKISVATTIYYVNLTGVDKGFYPNGVAFSPQDLKAPEVLEELTARTEIRDLRDAIVVSYGSPLTKGILTKYGQQLEQSNISSAQIDAINIQMQDELSTATERTLRISIDHGRLGASAEQGAELAALLPQVWSEVYTANFRILDNTKLSNAMLPAAISLNSTLGIIIARKTIGNILDTLGVIENDNRLQSLRTKSGVTPTDLRLQIGSLNDIYLNGVLSENVAAGDALAKVYLRDIILEIEKLDEEIEAIEEAITSLSEVLTTGPANSGQVFRQSIPGTQLLGDNLETKDAIVTRSALGEFLTKLYEIKSEMISKRADLKKQIKKVEGGVGFSKELISNAERELQSFIKLYSELLMGAREMNKRIAGDLHQAMSGPITTGSLLPPRASLTIMLSAVMGLFVSLVLAFLLPGRSEKVAK